ncbi:MAG: hypothetical protein ABSC94_29295 [Polyangiaceae bacterium]|jgi:hypothetical protein
MSKTTRSGRVRLQSYLEAALAERLDQFCAAIHATESAVVAAAIRQYLDGTSDATLYLRRLDRLGRAVARGQRDLELLSEAFAVFIRLWFAHTPPVPESSKRSARESAGSRFRQFVEHVAEQFSGGSRFLDDLPRESIGHDAELAALRTGGEMRSGGGQDQRGP